jgi:hypothetical protein
MLLNRTLICFLLLVGSQLKLEAQFKKFDSTLKVAKAGYRVYCNNKNPEKNTVTITPVGFEKEAREVSFEIKGRIKTAETDDLNNDGFPDLVMYIFTGVETNFGKVIGIYSEKNESIGPIGFPDILDDPKLRVGYKGFDEYSLMEGNLMRRFPMYQQVDSTKFEPSGMIRQLQYRVVPGENGGQKFKVIRTFDFKKQ